MHVNDVGSYAPPGYKLAGTLYEDGVAKHSFVALDGSEVVCTVTAHQDELSALVAFKAAHAPTDPPPPQFVEPDPPTRPGKRK